MVDCVSLTRSEATNSYEVNATRDRPPLFCLVLPEEEITAGNPYTMTVDLINVMGEDGVDHGHPGVMYNVIDENNFDYMHLRFVAWEKPAKSDVYLSLRVLSTDAESQFAQVVEWGEESLFAVVY